VATADVLFSIFDRLKDFIHRNADKRESEKKAANETLLAAVTIANRTIQYIARRRRENGTPGANAPTNQRDLTEESALSQEWAAAGAKLARLGPFGEELANRYFLKAQYWSDPDSWTQERIDSARIRLDELAEESRKFLLTGQ